MVLHAVAERNLPDSDSADDLQFLFRSGLIELLGGAWQATDNGQLLVALRREI